MNLRSGTTILFAAALALPASVSSIAQDTAPKSLTSAKATDSENATADAAWKRVGTPSDGPEPVNGVRTYMEAIKKWGDGSRTGYLNSPDYWRWCALRRLQFREEGLKFWRAFPNDERRYTWLAATIWPASAPYYWKDTEQAIHSKSPLNEPVDEVAVKAWNDLYPQLRSEFMASPQVTDNLRARLQFNELFVDIFALNQFPTSPLVRSNLLKQLIDRYMDIDRNPNNPDNDLYYGGQALRNTISDDAGAESALIDVMKNSKRTNIQIFGYGKEQIANLRSHPFELKTVTMSGTPVDVAKLRGKIVLVDVWSNNCTGCIAAMPRVKAVYDKYRDRGFEVVGVWLSTDEAGEKAKAIDILKEKAVNWPNAVVAGKRHDEFTKQYSVYYVPVTFLLDRDGKLVTNDVVGSKLEQEVKRLIDSPVTKRS